MFKTQMKRRLVSLQGFEHFDVIALVDKSRDNGKLLTICFVFIFCIDLDGLELVVFRKDASEEKCKLKYKLPHHHVILTVCTLIDHGSPNSFPAFSHLRKPWEQGWWLSTTKQRARNHSVIVKYVIACLFCPPYYMFLKLSCYGQYYHK